MCRLIGLKASDPVPLYRQLIGGDNSFAVQSLEHPDGWGVAHYQGGEPNVVKSVLPAICDELFEETAFGKSTTTMLAHVRRATIGRVARANCHPFRYGAWTFAHNGHIQSLHDQREAYLERVAPALRAGIEGQTDSELYFRLVLTGLGQRGSLDDRRPSIEALRHAFAYATGVVAELDAFSTSPDAPMMTCLMSSGEVLLGIAIGKPLAVRRLEHDGGAQVTFSSEAISCRRSCTLGDAWDELDPGEIVAIGPDLSIDRTQVKVDFR
jgi:glutamine amidotransferase